MATTKPAAGNGRSVVPLSLALLVIHALGDRDRPRAGSAASTSAPETPARQGC